MKRVKVKGFTLIELIIVIAIFSIIMFGALQLMQPSRKMFLRGYDTEDVTAAEKNIKIYLEDSLKYANYMRITDDGIPETDTDEAVEKRVRSFVCEHYNGMVDHTGAAGTGTVYAMYIDNAHGGVIQNWAYSYVAGNLNPDEMVIAKNGGNWNKWTDVAIKDYVPTVTLKSKSTSAVNAAMYDNYHFQISLGITKPEIVETSPGVPATFTVNAKVDPTSGKIVDLAKGETVKGKTDPIQMYKLVKDQSVYDNFKYTEGGVEKIDPDLAGFSAKNFGFTINAYKVNSGLYVDSGSGNTYYEQIYPMTACTNLSNRSYGCIENESTFLHHNWYQATDKTDATKKFWVLERKEADSYPEHKNSEDDDRKQIADGELDKYKWYSKKQKDADCHLSLSDQPFFLCDNLKDEANQASTTNIFIVYTYPEG
jgi:prepilin-type N-terminal cleavage/methylation domain-containing protein